MRYLTQRKTDSSRVDQGPGFVGTWDVANGVRVTVMGADAWKWIDSLAFARETFAPTWERLDLGTRKILLEYRGRVVRRTVQAGDSAAVASETEFPEPVLAFNQVEMIVRSVPLQVGYTVVLPLYSEIEGAVESDTITVESGPRKVDSRILWRVRFADPVIVAYYTVDGISHSVVSYESTSRATGARMWRLPWSM
ncbi:MAG: hypothetical protein ABI542_10055 [Gemmatimonadota bacterium]